MFYSLARFLALVLVPYFQFTSVFGFALMLNMTSQVWSGIVLSMYYVPDPSMVAALREEYINEIW